VESVHLGPRLEALEDVAHGADLVARPVVVQSEPYASEGKLVRDAHGEAFEAVEEAYKKFGGYDGSFLGAVELPTVYVEEDVPLGNAHAEGFVYSEVVGVLLEEDVALKARSLGAFEGDLAAVGVLISGYACPVLVTDDKIDVP